VTLCQPQVISPSVRAQPDQWRMARPESNTRALMRDHPRLTVASYCHYSPDGGGAPDIVPANISRRKPNPFPGPWLLWSNGCEAGVLEEVR